MYKIALDLRKACEYLEDIADSFVVIIIHSGKHILGVIQRTLKNYNYQKYFVRHEEYS